MQIGITPVHFTGRPNKITAEKVKQAGRDLKKHLPHVPMVTGSVGSGKPVIYIGVEQKAQIDTVKQTLRQLPDVTEDPKTKTLHYKTYPIEIFDGVRTL